MGSSEIVDGLIKDGLWDPYSHIHMGSCAEMCAERFGFDREAQVGEGVRGWQGCSMMSSRALCLNLSGPSNATRYASAVSMWLSWTAAGPAMFFCPLVVLIMPSLPSGCPRPHEP